MKHSTRLAHRVLVLCLASLLTLAWLTPAVAAQRGSVDCSSILLSYYPQPPEAGETIYLNAGVNSAIGNAPGYYGRWVLGEEDLGGSTIDEWSGCTTVVQFEYYCNGLERRAQLIIPGADCSSAFSLKGLGGVLVAAAVVVVALLLSRLFRRKPRQNPYVAPTAAPTQQFCGGCGKPLVPGDAFCQSCGKPVGK